MVCWLARHRVVVKRAAAPHQPGWLWGWLGVPWEPHRPIQLERGLWAHPTDPLGWWKPPGGCPLRVGADVVTRLLPLPKHPNSPTRANLRA